MMKLSALNNQQALVTNNQSKPNFSGYACIGLVGIDSKNGAQDVFDAIKKEAGTEQLGEIEIEGQKLFVGFGDEDGKEFVQFFDGKSKSPLSKNASDLIFNTYKQFRENKVYLEIDPNLGAYQPYEEMVVTEAKLPSGLAYSSTNSTTAYNFFSNKGRFDAKSTHQNNISVDVAKLFKTKKLN